MHFGSLVTAVGSFLDARTRGGQWLLRIEDIDTPRVVPGAADEILRTLESFGMIWDGSVVYQSRRLELYQEALTRLLQTGLAYRCTCSRRDIARGAISGPCGRVYPGTCRRGGRSPGRPEALRLRTDNRTITFLDRIQGSFSQNLESEVGDFVIRRADGFFAYQLAVVVDDADQRITHVVRGSDLLDSTPRQIFLQTQLGLPTPDYSHLPLAVDAQGNKLSKQTRANPVNGRRPAPTLVAALAFLRQCPPPELARATPTIIWDWARESWMPRRVPATTKLYPVGTATSTPSVNNLLKPELIRSF